MSNININKLLCAEYTNTIKAYNDIYNVFDPIVKKYWEQYYDDWQHFSTWYFSKDGEYIIVEYSFLDYNDEWEYDTDNIPILRMLEFANS